MPRAAMMILVMIIMWWPTQNTSQIFPSTKVMIERRGTKLKENIDRFQGSNSGLLGLNNVDLFHWRALFGWIQLYLSLHKQICISS